MTKKVTATDEEKYEMFELYEGDWYGCFKVSDNLFEIFNKIQCLAAEMRDFIHNKQQRFYRKQLNAS